MVSQSVFGNNCVWFCETAAVFKNQVTARRGSYTGYPEGSNVVLNIIWLALYSSTNGNVFLSGVEKKTKLLFCDGCNLMIKICFYLLSIVQCVFEN